VTYLGAKKAVHHWMIYIRLVAEGSVIEITPEIIGASNATLESHGIHAEIMVESKQEGGKIREIVPTIVKTGKNIGKKNETNCFTQAFRNALGLYNKHKKSIDTSCVAAAAAAGVGVAAPAAAADPSVTRPPAMLVKKMDDCPPTQADFDNGIIVQKKLNGVRLTTYMGEDGRLVMYSRTSGIYPGQIQICAELAPIISAMPNVADIVGRIMDHPNIAEIQTLYNNAPIYIDGELYLHGKPLNWISGEARKEGDKGELQYHIFDCFFPTAIAAGHNMESQHRQLMLDFVLKGLPADGFIRRVENFPVYHIDQIRDMSKAFIAEGYEGAIARKNRAGYRYGYNGYHSSNAMKIKPTFDSEFKIIGFEQGTKGKDLGAIIWRCELQNPIRPSESTFTVVPNLTYEDRYKLFKLMNTVSSNGATIFDRYVKGLPITVEYREISAVTGKPLQAKAVIVRTYESGRENNVFARLLHGEPLP
jgi:hypothetical protein